MFKSEEELKSDIIERRARRDNERYHDNTPLQMV